MNAPSEAHTVLLIIILSFDLWITVKCCMCKTRLLNNERLIFYSSFIFTLLDQSKMLVSQQMMVKGFICQKCISITKCQNSIQYWTAVPECLYGFHIIFGLCNNVNVHKVNWKPWNAVLLYNTSTITSPLKTLKTHTMLQVLLFLQECYVHVKTPHKCYLWPTDFYCVLCSYEMAKQYDRLNL